MENISKKIHFARLIAIINLYANQSLIAANFFWD